MDAHLSERSDVSWSQKLRQDHQVPKTYKTDFVAHCQSAIVLAFSAPAGRT